MNTWLLKTEPNDFSYDDLEARTREPWDGVRNFAALKHMAGMRPGDLAFIYHTGNQRQVVGVCQVVSEPYPDPGTDDPRFILVDVAPKYRLDHPVPLKDIKADHHFDGWDLVRLPRLSVMPVPSKHWDRIHDMAQGD